ncbi:SWEET sugar transporter [Dillenia turbinata]|uniref:Sugar transporter SWEET1 n=1 Tax=Dillenia turbinata TaxID=194707 RepID=A0AAN8Z174_9MAGN
MSGRKIFNPSFLTVEILQKNVIFVLLIEIIFVAIVAFLTFQRFHTHHSRSMFGRVIKTKSVKYMPFLLTLATFFNGVVWSVYAFLPVDPYILVPNGLGLLLTLGQLALYITYYKSTPREDENENKSEVELSQIA